MANRPNQLAGLAALGALGYIMSQKGQKNEAPVETRSFSPNPAPRSAPAAERSAPMARMVDNGDDRDVGGGFNPAGLRRNMETGEMYDPGTVPNRAVASHVNRSTVTPAALTPSAPAEGASSASSAAPAPAGAASRPASAASRPASAASAAPRMSPAAMAQSTTRMPGTPESVSVIKRSRGPQAGEEEAYRASLASKRPDLSTPEGRKRAEQEQALEGSHPEQFLMPGFGIKGVAALAKSLANRTPRLAEMTMQALPAPTARLTGPSAASIKEAERAARAAARQAEMRSDNAARYGLDPTAPGYEAAMRAMREQIGGGAFTVKKKGGAVKAKAKAATKKMASGGTTSGASKRGDGIAQRGKTRGKLY